MGKSLLEPSAWGEAGGPRGLWPLQFLQTPLTALHVHHPRGQQPAGRHPAAQLSAAWSSALVFSGTHEWRRARASRHS